MRNKNLGWIVIVGVVFVDLLFSVLNKLFYEMLSILSSTQLFFLNISFPYLL